MLSIYARWPCPGKTPVAERQRGIKIVLVVDGEIVDLNRIPLPADTPIIDERFEEKKTVEQLPRS